jgi:F-type H+-transporting ATPase subunit b
MELMTPNTGAILWTILTFVALLLILRKFAWKPILTMLDERESQIQGSLDLADKASKEAKKTLAEQSTILETARREGQEIVAKARQAAEASKNDIMQKASAEAEQLLQRASREIQLSRDKAMADMRDLAVELSMAATGKLIGKSLDKKDHEKLIKESLQKVGDLN